VHILLLEDDDDLREALSDLLLQEGAEGCVAAGSLAQVKEHAEEALGCDLAIIDVNLGEYAPSGIDAYRWLRARHFSGQVVMLTGYATSDPLVEQLRALPDVTVLPKPTGIDRLRPLVRSSPAS
jgi:DNA-binding response OmpR family regulator